MLKAHSINIFITIVIILALLFMKDVSIQNMGRLKEVFTLNIYHELTEKLFISAEIMSEQVLGKYLEEFAVPGLLLTFVYVMIIKTIGTTGFINIILASFTFRKNYGYVDKTSFKVLQWAAAISIINMALIITKVFVLSGRYVVALALILMIAAAFQFHHILKNISLKKLYWLAVALTVIMTLGLIKNIYPKAEGYNYLKNAAEWIKDNNPNNKPVFIDEIRIRYYAEQEFHSRGINPHKLLKNQLKESDFTEYEFLVTSHSIKNPEHEKFIIENLPNYVEIKRFYNQKREKFIIVYKKTN